MGRYILYHKPNFQMKVHLIYFLQEWQKNLSFLTDTKNLKTFLISNFCHVLYVVCFLLGNSLASEFYMTFRNTLSVPSS